MEDSTLRAFLADSLALWGVAGEVNHGQGNVLAEVHATSGAIIWIERAAEDAPFRWHARWRAVGEAPGGVRELRPRACGSLVGLLAAMRVALGVEHCIAVRIVPSPERT